MLAERHIEEIRNIIRGRVLQNAALSGFTSFKIGGLADLLAEPTDSRELGQLLLYLHEERIDCLILGAGTNVLFHDSGFRGVIIRTAALDEWEIQQNGSDHCRVTLSAGVPLPAAVSRACKAGLHGMEALWGIPGSFGGAMATNAGAGGIAIADLLESIALVDRVGKEILVPREDLNYTYRTMYLPEGSVAIQGIIRLVRADRGFIAEKLELARSLRRKNQPTDRPSAGCVFKNPSPDVPAGALIDRLGFKGIKAGGAQVSEVHANFIINTGNATAEDVLQLIETIRNEALRKEHVNLELELCVIGEGRTHE
jgi:UDP-N-acetylmuramate dehydrogenase